MTQGRRHVALFVPSLSSGGVAHSQIRLAGGLAARGHRVDLVLCRAEGPYLDRVPASVEIVALEAAPAWRGRLAALAADPGGLAAQLRPVLLPPKAAWELRHLPALARYLARARPAALIAAKINANLLAVWAKRLAGVATRIVVSERGNVTHAGARSTARRWRYRFRPRLVRRVYSMADGIVAVSNGVADDLARRTGLPRDRITTIYNPIVDDGLRARARAPLDEPWFAAGQPPVILGVGRLDAQKDFPTLIRAFARLRARRAARLVILGDGPERATLEALGRELGVQADLAMPGWRPNPMAYMARASVFALSSAWEGLPGVLIEALACGTPVVSTDCPSGPAEILDGGAFGPLVPVGDDAALADAIATLLDNPPAPDLLRARSETFSAASSVDRYLDLIGDLTGSPDRPAAAS